MAANWCYSAGFSTAMALEVSRVAVQELKLGTWLKEFNIMCRNDDSAYAIKGRTNIGHEFSAHIWIGGPSNGDLTFCTHQMTEIYRAKFSRNSDCEITVEFL